MKRIFSIMLAATLLFAFSVDSAALSAPKIADINESYWESLGAEGYAERYASLNGVSVSELSSLDISAGDEIRIDLVPQAFVDAEGVPMSDYGWREVTLTQLSAGKIDVKKQTTSGAQALEEIKIGYDKDANGAYISIKFVDTFVSTKELDFSYVITLAVSGKRNSSTAIHVGGTIKNPVQVVGSQTSYIDLSEGIVAEAEAYVKNVMVDLGNGVLIITNFFEGSKYYGVAKLDAADDRLMAANPDIQMVYTLRTVGLKKEGNDVVYFDLPETYYVYNSQGEYLGPSRDPVAYSSKYYMSKRQLDWIDLPETHA